MRRGFLLAVAGLAAALAACGLRAGEPVTTTTKPSDTVTTSGTVSSSAPNSTTTTTTTTTPSATTAPTTTISLPELKNLRYAEVASGLPFPIGLTARPGSSVAYLATKDGRVWTVQGDSVSATPVLDIRNRVRNEGEQGLLGLALHPTDTGRVFLHYSATDGDTVLTEYTVTGTAIDPGSERVLLRLDQPAPNHNGGMIQFGPDGYLYLGLGDGGAANDRFGNGQRTDTLLAAILRLDVNGERPYAIPPDNPFADGEDGAREVWAWGLRNPWRFWIDAPGDAIYVGDVGQGTYEEVDVARLALAGANYGWPVTEGLHCFSPSSGCEVAGFVLPVVEIQHGDAGTCSVTGGVVYRGATIPELAGHYLYSDFCGGYLRSFRWDGTGAVDQQDWTDEVGNAGRVVSFGVDGSGEVYVLTTDRLLRLEAER